MVDNDPAKSAALARGKCPIHEEHLPELLAQECGYDFRLLEEVMRINDDQRQRFLHKVRKALWTIKGKRVGALGLAFKGGTDDVRESPALAIIESLVAEGCEVQAYDPAASQRAREVLGTRGVRYVDSAYAAAENADALLVLTEWEKFRNIDLARVRELLRYPNGDRWAQPVRPQDHAKAWLPVPERWPARGAIAGRESAKRNGGPGVRFAKPKRQRRVPVSRFGV
jgi:UDPglucose 6-dehydrogenase